MVFNFLVETIRMLGVLLTTFYIWERSVNHSLPYIHKILSILWCMLWAIFYAAESTWIPPIFFRLLMCISSIIVIFLLTKMKLDTVASGFLLSFGISYCLFYIASFLIGIIFMPLLSGKNIPGTPLDFNRPFYILLYSLTYILQLILAVLLFRIRRFKNGFPFLFKRYTIIATLIFTGAILIFVTWIKIITASEDAFAAYLYFAGVIVSGIGIYIWIRRGIKMFQRRRNEQRSDEYYTQLLAEKDKEIQRLKALTVSLENVIHRYTRRIESAENASIQGSLNLDEIQTLQREFQEDLARIRGKNSLPSTNIPAIDNIFSYFAEQFAEFEIDFHLKVNGSITYMVEKIIKQSELETMIGDHLKDAMIAINGSDSPFRSVMVIIGLTGEQYELTIFDSGIPFEVDTLARLGTDRVTTHAQDGGSGIGFMTTFETMQKCSASLIISEQNPSNVDYSKSVAIIFDGKNQYIIKTHRPDDFPKNDRYTVVGNVKL